MGVLKWVVRKSMAVNASLIVHALSSSSLRRPGFSLMIASEAIPAAAIGGGRAVEAW